MQRGSKILLGVCVVIAAALAWNYLSGRSQPETFTSTRAAAMIRSMQHAVAEKNVGEIMAWISPDPETRIANLREDQLRILLARAFRQSGKLRADVANLSTQQTGDDATTSFDLSVYHIEGGLTALDYPGHITLHLRRIEVPHLLGLYRTRDWKIVGAETTGPDPTLFGD